MSSITGKKVNMYKNWLSSMGYENVGMVEGTMIHVLLARIPKADVIVTINNKKFGIISKEIYGKFNQIDKRRVDKIC